MKPIDFEGSNVVFAKDQPEYLPLPALRTADGVVVSCWDLTWREALRLCFRRRLWLMQLTFNQPLQPLLPSVECPIPRPPAVCV